MTVVLWIVGSAATAVSIILLLMLLPRLGADLIEIHWLVAVLALVGYYCLSQVIPPDVGIVGFGTLFFLVAATSLTRLWLTRGDVKYLVGLLVAGIGALSLADVIP